jgi:hypothetical protein
LIINDQYKFVFIHIPKCAGTTLRKFLGRYNDWQIKGPRFFFEHPELGPFDYAHIPLFTLREYFAEEFEKLTNYWTFAVIRDPHTRFSSSVSQWFITTRSQPIYKYGLKEIKAEIESIISFLSAQPRKNYQLPAEYIHFQKQVDYLYLDGKQEVDTIYTVNDIEILLDDVSRRVGCDLLAGNHATALERENCAVVHRSEFMRHLVESSRPLSGILKIVLSDKMIQSIRSSMYIPRDQRLYALFSANYVLDFIQDYYSEDLKLWDEVTNQ